jgi:plasmid maintenance system antidote protein VapI
MTPSEIQKMIKDAKTTQRAIALQIGVHPVTVSEVVNGKKVSDRVMRGVADAVGYDYRLVFADYYLRPPKRKTSKACPRAF